MLRYLAVLALVLAVASQGIAVVASSSKTNPSLVKIEKAGTPQDASASDTDSPIAGPDSGPTFIYNTQKEQQKDKWDKAAIVSHFVLAGVGAIGLILAILILNKLKRQTEVLEQTLVLQHRPRLQMAGQGRRLQRDRQARRSCSSNPEARSPSPSGTVRRSYR